MRGRCYNRQMGPWGLSRLIPLVCLLAGVAAGQIQVHFGAEAGVPLSDTLASSSSSSTTMNLLDVPPQPIFSFNRYNSETKRLLIGPAFRVEMQSGLGFEVDALYQRVDFDLATFSQQSGPGAVSNQSFEQTTANRWQFPVLIQYTGSLPRWKMRWFAEAGPSISHIGDSHSTFSSMSSGPPTSSSTSSVAGQGATWAGITAGGGIDIPVSRVHLRPEFRYSHWFAQNGVGVPEAVAGFTTSLSNFLLAPAVPAISSFRINQNEASLLVALTF